MGEIPQLSPAWNVHPNIIRGRVKVLATKAATVTEDSKLMPFVYVWFKNEENVNTNAFGD